MKPIVVFDDTCEFCCHCIDYLKKRMKDKPNELIFLPASIANQELRHFENKDFQRAESVSVILDGQKTLTRFRAIQEICDRLHIFRFISRIKSPLLIKFFDICYNFISRHRKSIFFRLFFR